MHAKHRADYKEPRFIIDSIKHIRQVREESLNCFIECINELIRNSIKTEPAHNKQNYPGG
jgi:hypothetical protein